jgi:CDP-paratose 2-epimerase
VRPTYRLEPWRTADQRYYVSDTSGFETTTGWRPTVDVADGLARLAGWLAQSGTARRRRLAGAGVAS